ncbi:FCD domain-containing protein [Mumia zhuanghuii]|uniref:FCD domain-containing protein n=1 Tax=Mumia zhuanghuii TaxID=2585211 RepID=UPI0036444521
MVSLGEATEICEVRMVVEALCAAKAADRVDDAARALLQQIAAEMRMAVAAGDVFGYSELNQRPPGTAGPGWQRAASDVLDRLHGRLVRHQFGLATRGPRGQPCGSTSPASSSPWILPPTPWSARARPSRDGPCARRTDPFSGRASSAP